LLISGQARPPGQLTPQHRRRRQAHRPQLRAGHLPPGRPHRRRAARRPAS
jgi:hypothetical protein